MRLIAIVTASLILLGGAAAHGAEMSIGTNFTVLAPSRAVADAVERQAEFYRRQSALEWLGKELPGGSGRSLITVEISPQRDEGATWPIDRAERTLHQVWLTTSVERAIGSTLHHEVIHTVLDSNFYPQSLPAWASEGIASQADDAGRKQSQQQLLARWSQADRWPDLRSLFEAPAIAHDNLNRYATASSVIEFLVARDGKLRAVAFASNGQRLGWDQAAREYYGTRDLAELQAEWQGWVRKQIGAQGARQ